MNISRSSPQTRFDVVIVGGGHNGLTCACYLAKSGLRGRLRAPLHPRRRRRHRGIPPRLPQLHRELHGQPAEPQGHQGPAPGRARPEGARAAHAELPAAARWPRAHRRPGQRPHHRLGAQLLGTRRGTPARLLQDARRSRHAAAITTARNSTSGSAPAARPVGRAADGPPASANSMPVCSATSTSCSRAAPATC